MTITVYSTVNRFGTRHRATYRSLQISALSSVKNTYRVCLSPESVRFADSDRRSV